MSKIKPLVREVRSNATWDGIKFVLWVTGGALMSTGAFSALIRYLSSIPLDVWLIIGIFVLSVILIGVGLAIGRRNKRSAETKGSSPADSQITQPPEAAPESDAGKSTDDFIAQLQSEKDAVDKQIEELNQKHQSEIEVLNAKHKSTQLEHEDEIRGRERVFTDLKWQIDVLKEQVDGWNKYDWLVSLATVQANDISDYVVVERVYFCYHRLTEAIPRIVFGVDIYNKSVFDITIEDAMHGYIEIGGQPLLREKRIIHNPRKISPISKERLTIEQRLSPEEAAHIAQHENKLLGAFFYFDRLTITVGGGTQFPHFERTRLTLPKFIGSNDAESKLS